MQKEKALGMFRAIDEWLWLAHANREAEAQRTTVGLRVLQQMTFLSLGSLSRMWSTGRIDGVPSGNGLMKPFTSWLLKSVLNIILLPPIAGRRHALD